MQALPCGHSASLAQRVMQYCPQSKQPSHEGSGSRPHTISTSGAIAGAAGQGVSPSVCDQHTCEHSPAMHEPLSQSVPATQGSRKPASAAAVLSAAPVPVELSSAPVELVSGSAVSVLLLLSCAPRSGIAIDVLVPSAVLEPPQSVVQGRASGPTRAGSKQAGTNARSQAGARGTGWQWAARGFRSPTRDGAG